MRFRIGARRRPQLLSEVLAEWRKMRKDFLPSLRWPRLGVRIVAMSLLCGGTSVALGQAADDAGDNAAAAVDDNGGTAAVDLSPAFGEPSPPAPPYQQPPPLTTQPAPSDWYSQWLNLKKDLKDTTGTSFDLYLNPTDQAIVAGPGAGHNRGDIWYNFNLTQQLWDGASIVTNTRGGDGKGLNRYVDTLLNFNRNTDEAGGVYISHFYLQQKLFNDHLTLAGGKLDLADTFDDNAVATWNFMPYNLARDPSIPMPYHAIGLVARADFTSWLYAAAGVADDGGNVTQTGFNTAFKSAEPYFSMYEIGVEPKLLERPGTFRFLLWDEIADLAKFDNTGNIHGDVGAAISFDQQITDHLGLFTRCGYADPAIHPINVYWSAGGTYQGLIPGRKNDVLGFAVDQAEVSDDYRRVNGGSSSQSQVDLFYTIQIQPWICVTPDVQVVVNPTQSQFDNATNAVLVMALNFELRF
jgi:hypothetical protein